MPDAPQAVRRQTIKMSPNDDVAMALHALSAGSRVEVENPGGGAVEQVQLVEDIPLGHKFALRELKRGHRVIKYNMEIGTALKDIAKGAAVGEHNLE